ncbi:MAG: hypothetical protein BWY27_01168 [Bacteroidetes bacterium ADurb.Bin234]|nr:MAG: hypothetical protein BWY27_01168 [Bacteroidetes bacterium ADurb.Bin234]
MKTKTMLLTMMQACILMLFILGMTLTVHGSVLEESFVNKKITNIKTENKLPMEKVSLNVSSELNKAKKEGKVVFLVITGNNAIGIEKALKIAKEANVKVPKSAVIQMNKDNSENSSLVTELRVANVPIPFILVISSKGIPVAGYSLAQATSAILVKAVPSPKQDEVTAAIIAKKPVFIVVSKKGLSDKTAIINTCKTASANILSKPVIIEIDFNDTKETAFLKQIGVESINDKTKTVAVNALGQITAVYEGTMSASILQIAATKTVKSGGCCPGGSKTGCGK